MNIIEQLINAAKDNLTDNVRTILYSGQIEATVENLKEPLSWAAHNKRKSVIEELIKFYEYSGKNKSELVNAQDKDGNTALHWARYTGPKEDGDLLYKQLIKFLIENGADDTIENKNGLIPLVYACSSHNSAARASAEKEISRLLKLQIQQQQEQQKAFQDTKVTNYSSQDSDGQLMGSFGFLSSLPRLSR